MSELPAQAVQQATHVRGGGRCPQVAFEHQPTGRHFRNDPGHEGRLAHARGPQQHQRLSRLAVEVVGNVLAQLHSAHKGIAALHAERLMNPCLFAARLLRQRVEPGQLLLDQPFEVRLHAGAEGRQIELHLALPPGSVLVTLPVRKEGADPIRKSQQPGLGLLVECQPAGAITHVVGKGATGVVRGQAPGRLHPAQISQDVLLGRHGPRLDREEPLKDLLMGGRRLVLDSAGIVLVPALHSHGTGQRLTQDGFRLAPFIGIAGRLQEILDRQGVVIALEPVVEMELVLVGQHPPQSLELVGGDAWRQRPPAVTAAQQQHEVGPGAAALTAFDLLQADFQRLLVATGVLADAPAQVHGLEARPSFPTILLQPGEHHRVQRVAFRGEVVERRAEEDTKDPAALAHGCSRR